MLEDIFDFLFTAAFGDENSDVWAFIFLSVIALSFLLGLIPAGKILDEHMLQSQPYVVKIDGKLYRLEKIKGRYKDKNASAY